MSNQTTLDGFYMENDEILCAKSVLQMWTSARSLPSLRASISVSTLWAPSAVSAILDTSSQDTAASVSQLTVSPLTGYAALLSSRMKLEPLQKIYRTSQANV